MIRFVLQNKLASIMLGLSVVIVVYCVIQLSSRQDHYYFVTCTTPLIHEPSFVGLFRSFDRKPNGEIETDLGTYTPGPHEFCKVQKTKGAPPASYATQYKMEKRL